MRAYVGQTRSVDLVLELQQLGIGECTVRGELPPRRSPYFHDNGAFRDWEAAKLKYPGRAIDAWDLQFDAVRWTRDLWWMRDHHQYEDHPLPEFVVVPDVPGACEESLRVSAAFVGDVPSNIPVALAVQDGMESYLNQPGGIYDVIGEYNWIFVGGTDEFKARTSQFWVDLAHRKGKRCHIGRVGTATKVRWAYDLGADSIDSSFPLFTKENMAKFVDALDEVGCLP